MGAPKNLKKEFPSVVDSAYLQYQRDLSRFKKANEIMTPNVVTITPEASMREAAKIMGEKHIGSLIVKKYETPVGIVTERDLLTKVLATGKDLEKETVEHSMSYPLATLCVTAKIKEAAQMMMSKKSRLAVFECGNLRGIITASDLIRSLPEVPETDAKVESFMSKVVVTADEKAPVANVAKTMGEKRIGSVVITSNKKPFRIFTERDLLTEFLAKDKSLNTEVGKAASRPLITISAKTSVHKAAVTMTAKHVRRLPIVAHDDLVGIITARDLVEAYAK